MANMNHELKNLLFYYRLNWIFFIHVSDTMFTQVLNSLKETLDGALLLFLTLRKLDMFSQMIGKPFKIWKSIIYCENQCRIF